MNIYSWFTTKEKYDGGFYKCNIVLVFPGQTFKCDSYPFYKPNRKGGHRHNAITNAFRRAVRRSKERRKSYRKRIKRGIPDCFVYWEDYANQSVLNKKSRKGDG